MQNGTYRVLFLSRRNSARSVMAEAILNKIGKGRFEAISAAVDPAPMIEPNVLELLRNADYPIAELTPRHFGSLAGAGAAKLDFVFTLSDTAAGEALPEWPGLPITAHWGCQDPILAEGEVWQRKKAFMQVFVGLERRLNIFIDLPFSSLDRMSLQNQVRGIGDVHGG